MRLGWPTDPTRLSDFGLDCRNLRHLEINPQGLPQQKSLKKKHCIPIQTINYQWFNISSWINQISHIKSLISQSWIMYPSIINDLSLIQSDNQGVPNFDMSRNCEEPTGQGQGAFVACFSLEQLSMGWTFTSFYYVLPKMSKHCGTRDLNYWFILSWLGYIGKSNLIESLSWILYNPFKLRHPKHAFRGIAHQNDRN